MAIKYLHTKYAFNTTGPSLTEQEHKDSCDINIMIKSVQRGQQIRGSAKPSVYGYDDTTIDGVQHRIQKQQLEESLTDFTRKNELDTKELKLIPPQVQQKFGFKEKKAQPKPPAPQNDDKTTNTKAVPDASNKPDLQKPPTPSDKS